MAVTDPTAEELRDLSLACSKLWDLDNNRLEPSRDYEINLGRGKKCFQEGDAAPQPLFVRVDAGALQGRRTFAAFCSLLDNYERCCSSCLSPTPIPLLPACMQPLGDAVTSQGTIPS